MGLPIAQLMIATNINDILARVLKTGTYKIGDVVASTSPSMDIQVSSNFERLLFELTGRDGARVNAYMAALQQSGRFEMSQDEVTLMRAMFGAARIDQQETLDIMRQVKDTFGMQIDPHSAIGVGAARKAILPDEVPIVSLATAHPAKFPKAVHEAYDDVPDTPQRVTDMLARQEHFTPIANSLSDVQALIRAKTA
jgi:threonine synthase